MQPASALTQDAERGRLGHPIHPRERDLMDAKAAALIVTILALAFAAVLFGCAYFGVQI
jgi:hypothetical protein